MLSKEEIKKARKTCNSIVNFCENNKECQENEFCPDCYIEIEDVKAIKILLQYIDQLEQENKKLTHTNKSYKGMLNKQNKIIDEMIDMISSLDLTINMVAFGGQARFGSNEEIKQYFEKKVEEK